MNVQRRLQMAVAALAALGTLMLGLSQRSLLLPILAVAVSASSVYLTDLRGWLRLNTALANLAGAGVVMLTLWQYSIQFAEENRLLALTSLLVYLQFIVLYQYKTPRVYWQIFMLSFLQVSVGAALNLSASYGLFLMAYLVLALVALTYFHVYREGIRFAKEPGAAGGATGSYASGELVFTSRLDPQRIEGLRGRFFVPPLSWMTVFTVFVAAGMFCFIPRVGRTQLLHIVTHPQHMVGFSESVTLGELGEIVESTEAVMRVRFLDAENQPFRPTGEPLLRGTTLTDYRSGQWRPGRQSLQRGFHPTTPPPDYAPVTQEITIEPLDTEVLFAVYPVEKPRDLRIDEVPRRRHLLYRGRRSSEKFTYRLKTYGIHRGAVADIVPIQGEFGLPYVTQLLQLPDNAQPGGGAQRESLTELRRQAQQVTAAIPAGDVVGRAQALCRHLRDSGRFQYTLSPPLRNQELDPIEDFVSQHSQGHCEYFASALALMLRSQGIPARLVVGFRGGEWNTFGDYYQVRQLHAHTWVEVYLNFDELPPRYREEPRTWRAGGWLILDPTPDDESTDQLGTVTWWDRLRQMIDFGQLMWSTYVLDMSVERQRESIYQPMRRVVGELSGGLLSRESLQHRLPALVALLREWFGHAWYGWLVGLSAVVGLMLLVALGWGAVRLAPRVWQWWRRRRLPPRGREKIVEFYRRLEEILARHDLRRQPGQTQREFALAAGGQLAEQPQTHGAAALPRRITEVFYRVRFGDRALDSSETLQVEQALRELSDALQTHRDSRRR